MAVNFPDSPSNGDTFTSNGVTYVYDANINAWTVVPGSSLISAGYGDKFILVIPIDGISSGTPSTETTITFDRGFSRNVKHRVLRANFGDGYDQTILDGVNPKDDKFTANFKNRREAEINLLADYLDKTAAGKILIKVPNSDGIENIYVRCESYTIAYNYDQYHDLSAQLKRVYVPS